MVPLIEQIKKAVNANTMTPSEQYARAEKAMHYAKLQEERDIAVAKAAGFGVEQPKP